MFEHGGVGVGEWLGIANTEGATPNFCQESKFVRDVEKDEEGGLRISAKIEEAVSSSEVGLGATSAFSIALCRRNLKKSSSKACFGGFSVRNHSLVLLSTLLQEILPRICRIVSSMGLLRAILIRPSHISFSIGQIFGLWILPC